METDASSPEKKIKDEIREAYAKTYPNCIFSLTNHIERLKAELKALETALAAKDSEILNARREVTEAYVLSLQHILDGVIVLDTPKLVIRIEKTIRDLMEADLSLSPPTEPEECEWVQEDPFGSGDSCIWQTDCGHEFVFDEGTPSDNGAKWCLYCGKKLVERAVEDTQ